MGIRDQLAAHDAKFISFSELLAAIAEEDGVTIQEVARAWSLEPILRALKPVLRLHGDGDFAEGDGSAHQHELECALNGGKAWMDDAAQSELRMGEPGFFRYDAETGLLVACWPIPARLAEPAGTAVAKPVPSVPVRSDLLSYVPRVNIALDDAAMILGNEHSNGAWGHWRDSLSDAVDAGRIQAGTWGLERGEQPLFHDDIRAWCKAMGILWPVPLPKRCESDATADDSDLKAELDRARARIAELESERAELLKRIEATAATVGAAAIKSPTLQRIIEAVGHYPAWRATKPQEPNLKSVLDWQENQQREKGNGSRVAHVAHHVIAEHFGLKS